MIPGTVSKELKNSDRRTSFFQLPDVMSVFALKEGQSKRNVVEMITKLDLLRSYMQWFIIRRPISWSTDSSKVNARKCTQLQSGAGIIRDRNSHVGIAKVKHRQGRYRVTETRRSLTEYR